jgi:hypothetical protein
MIRGWMRKLNQDEKAQFLWWTTIHSFWNLFQFIERHSVSCVFPYGNATDGGEAARKNNVRVVLTDIMMRSNRPSIPGKIRSFNSDIL